MLSPLPAQDPGWAPEWWQVRPFTRDTAMSMGMRKRDLYGPDFRQVMRGVFIADVIPDTIVVRARAARLLLPRDAMFSHHTAARLLGGPVPDVSVIHASLGRSYRQQVAQLHVHRYTYVPDAIWRHGLPVTTAPQTFIHLALKLDLLHVVAFGDAMVRRGRVTLDDLRDAIEGWSGQGARAASRAMDFVRDGVDSPPETHMRMLFRLAGLLEPELNYTEYDEEGTILKRVELAYTDTPRPNRIGKRHLGFEYDGRKWHSTDEQKARDLARRGRLAEEGWHIEVVTGDLLYRDTEAFLHRARDLMEEFGIVVPRRLSDEWRRHFWAPTFVPAQ